MGASPLHDSLRVHVVARSTCKIRLSVWLWQIPFGARVADSYNPQNAELAGRRSVQRACRETVAAFLWWPALGKQVLEARGELGVGGRRPDKLWSGHWRTRLGGHSRQRLDHSPPLPPRRNQVPHTRRPSDALRDKGNRFGEVHWHDNQRKTREESKAQAKIWDAPVGKGNRVIQKPAKMGVRLRSLVRASGKESTRNRRRREEFDSLRGARRDHFLNRNIFKSGTLKAERRRAERPED